MKYLLVVIFTMFSVIVEASTPVKIQSFGFKGGLTISNATGYVNAVHEALGAKNEYHILQIIQDSWILKLAAAKEYFSDLKLPISQKVSNTSKKFYLLI